MENDTQFIEGTHLVGKWDYQARDVVMSNGDSELSFKRGQPMKLVKVLSSEWLRVEMVQETDTRLGVVPKSYVTSPRGSLERTPSNDAVLSPENNENLLEGKFDYTSNGIVMSNGDKDLSFRKYDKMILLEKCPNQWLKVKLLSTGEVGVVPANYARLASHSENRKTFKPRGYNTIAFDATDYATFVNISYEMSRPVARNERDRSQSDLPMSQVGPKSPLRRAMSESYAASAPNSPGGTPHASPPATPEDSPVIPRNKSHSKMSKVLGVSEDSLHMLVHSPQETPRLEKQRSSSKLKKLLGVHDNSLNKGPDFDFPESYPFRHPDSYDRIIFALETSDNGIPLIRAATLEKLIEKLTHHESVDPDFVYEFLLTFRCFSTPQQVLQLLKSRYNTPEPTNVSDKKELDRFQSSFVKPIRLRISNVLKKWIEEHWYDFTSEPSLLNEVKTFLDEMKQSGMEASASALTKLIQKKQEGKGKESETSTKSRPDPIEPDMKVLTSLESTHQILAFHPLEIARQLTLIEFQTYTKIQPRECLGQNWSKKERQHKAENVVALIQRFNKVSQWVTSTIVQIDSVKSRADVLIKFIEVAEHFNKMNNVSGMMQMAAGLRHSSIHRLKRTWAAVPSKKVKAWDDIVQLLDPYSNYSSLRIRMKTAPPPLLPYLGMFLTDFTFIEDGNPDDLSGLINFDKWRRLATSVKELIHFQENPYNFVPLPIIQAFLLAGGEYVDESMVYQMSLKIEPRQGGKVKVSGVNWRKSTNIQKKEMLAQRAQSMQQFYAFKKKEEELQNESKDESLKARHDSVDSQGSTESEASSPTSSFLSLTSELQLEEYLQTLNISDSEKQLMRDQYTSSEGSRGSSRRGSVDEFEDPPLDELVELLLNGQTQKFEEYFEGLNPDHADSIKAQVSRLHHAVLAAQQK